MATRACHLTAVQCGAAEPPHRVTSLCSSLVAYILVLPWAHQRHLEVSGLDPWAVFLVFARESPIVRSLGQPWLTGSTCCHCRLGCPSRMGYSRLSYCTAPYTNLSCWIQCNYVYRVPSSTSSFLLFVKGQYQGHNYCKVAVLTFFTTILRLYNSRR